MQTQSITSIDLAGNPPASVQLLPAGTFTGRDGRGPYRLNVQSVLNEFANWGMPLAIDYEHQGINAVENGNPAPASGWIVKLEALADGIWGKVEWTGRASAMVSAKEYRYLSPVFDHKMDGEVVRLTGAGLTNNPNLYLKAIASRGAQQTIPHRSMNVPVPPGKALLFDAAMRSGLIPANQKEHARQLCTRDPQGFDIYIQSCRKYREGIRR